MSADTLLSRRFKEKYNFQEELQIGVETLFRFILQIVFRSKFRRQVVVRLERNKGREFPRLSFLYKTEFLFSLVCVYSYIFPLEARSSFSFNSLWLKPIRRRGFVQAFQTRNNDLNNCDSRKRDKLSTFGWKAWLNKQPRQFARETQLLYKKRNSNIVRDQRFYKATKLCLYWMEHCNSVYRNSKVFC